MPPKTSQLTYIECAEYDFDAGFPPNSFVIVFGTPGKGKTTLTRLFLQHLPTAFTSQHIFMVGTELVKKHWRAVSHAYYVMDPSIEHLQKIVKQQQDRIQFCEVNKFEFPPWWHVTLVIDDTGAFLPFMHNVIWNELSANRRNLNMTVIGLIQNLNHFKKDVRRNATVFISLEIDDQSDLKRIHDERASKYSMSDFEAICEGVTRNYGALVLGDKQIMYTHAERLHPDGFEAIAECELSETVELRVKKGLPPKEFTHFLKTLGSTRHTHVADVEYRIPSRNNMSQSSELFRAFSSNNNPPRATQFFPIPAPEDEDLEIQEYKSESKSSKQFCTDAYLKGSTTVYFNPRTSQK